MKLSAIPGDTVVCPGCRSVFLEGGSSACLLLHGFSGYPGEMRYLGDRLHEAGFTVSIPRLPGHGTNTADFLQTRWQDWLRRCTDAYLELAGRYEKIFICGLSMGGTLAVLLAARFNPAGCLLYAPGVAVSNPLFPLVPLMRLFVRRVPTGYQETTEDPDRRYLADEYWKWRYAVPTSQFYRLYTLARRSLYDLRCDTCVFISTADRTVPVKAADIIQKRTAGRASVDIIRLEKSGHVLVNDSQKETVADETLTWLKRR
ncbi:MAG: alpha/beta fold hydrolase [Spirochaetales bacterium]|nr:alpha/beta fold hydrolase [Spirochaetales bacterium]